MQDRSNIFITRNYDSYFSISEAIHESGFSYECPVLKNEIIEANRLISEKLQLPIATKICSFRKLRIVEGWPMCIEQIYVDAKSVPDLPKTDMTDLSFYSWCKDKYGYSVTKSIEEIKVVMASDEEAKLLMINPRDEVMMLDGVSYVEKYRPFEYYQIISIPGFYRFRSVNNNGQ